MDGAARRGVSRGRRDLSGEAGHDHREAGPAVPQPEGADLAGRVLEGVERGRRRGLRPLALVGPLHPEGHCSPSTPSTSRWAPTASARTATGSARPTRRRARCSPNSVIAAIKAGTKNPSISPPDGRGYCQCDKCKAQDDPKVDRAVERHRVDLEPLRRLLRRRRPAGGEGVPGLGAELLRLRRLHAAADARRRSSSPNLCAVIAPIRYCRLHALGDPNCPSRKQQVEMIDGWAKVASRLGYYNYMYNLADATLPMFKFTPCKEEFPYLAETRADVHDHRGAVELVPLRPADLPEPAAWPTTRRLDAAAI